MDLATEVTATENEHVVGRTAGEQEVGQQLRHQLGIFSRRDQGLWLAATDAASDLGDHVAGHREAQRQTVGVQTTRRKNAVGGPRSHNLACGIGEVVIIAAPNNVVEVAVEHPRRARKPLRKP